MSSSAFSTASLNAGLPSGSANNSNADELGSHFKAAALSIATFYKSALANASTSHAAGYRACLMDLQTFMNAGVSLHGGSGHPNVDELTIERVMDWIEARLEALKEDDDSEDDGTDKDQRGKAATRGSEGTSATRRQHNPAASTSSPPRASRTSENKRSGRRSPDHDRDEHQSRQQNSAPPPPPSSRHSSPSSPRSIPPSISNRSITSRKDRERHSLPAGILQNLQHYPFDFAIPTSLNIPQGLGLVTDPALTNPVPITIISSDGSATSSPPGATPTTGSKRRHASMNGADTVAPNGTPMRPVTQSQNSASRRRARSGRLSTGPGSNRSNDAGAGAGVGGMLVYEPMEVEERARKVPRR